MRRRPAVAVIGSGTEPHREWSEPLGRWLAEQGFDLVNGGGSGVMEACARAFAGVSGRRGRAIGILPAREACDSPEARKRYTSPPGYPNPFVDIVIRTHLPLLGPNGLETASRNHIVVLTADRIVALPGGAGTRSEIQLALEYGRPLRALGPKGSWPETEREPSRVESLEEVYRWLGSALE